MGHGVYGLGKGAKSKLATSPFQGGACDCIEFIGYGFGFLPHEPGFNEYGGDINCDSALMNAGAIPGDHESGSWFTEIVEAAAVEPGDLVMFPSVRARELKDSSLSPTARCRIGHVGMVSGWKGRPVAQPSTTNVPWDGDIAKFLILECSGGEPAVTHGWDKNFHASNNRVTVMWKGKTFTNPMWRTRVIRYVGP